MSAGLHGMLLEGEACGLLRTNVYFLWDRELLPLLHVLLALLFWQGLDAHMLPYLLLQRPLEGGDTVDIAESALPGILWKMRCCICYAETKLGWGSSRRDTPVSPLSCKCLRRLTFLRQEEARTEEAAPRAALTCHE
jgi:hypothetical protein